MLNYTPPAVGEPAVLDTFERTASDEVRVLIDTLRAAYEQNRGRSQIRELLDQLNTMNGLLNQLYFVPDDWNGYGSPSPSKGSIEATRDVLNSLWREAILPDKALPSADGGVALLFRSPSQNRAAIESLNEGGTFVLLYDRQGNSKTLIWEGSEANKQAVLRNLQRHLRGSGLAVA